MRHGLIMCILLASCGCSGGYWGPVLEVSPPESVMGRYDVTVSSTATVATMPDENIEIDIIALTNDQYCEQKWFSCPLKSYFAGSGHALRDDSPTWRTDFPSGGAAARTLNADDPLWSVWEADGATHLVILAKQPGPGASSGNDDARRLVLPLDRSRWLDDDIEVRLMSSGLVLRTRRLPPWPGQPKARFKRY